MAGLDQHTVMALHCDGSNGSTAFPDAMAMNVVTAGGNAAVTNSQYQFGGGSLSLPDNASYLSIPNAPYFSPAGPYTIDFWMQPVTVPANQTAFLRSNFPFYCPFAIYRDNNGACSFYASSNGTSWDIANDVGFGISPTNVWTHIALVWSGSTYYLFKNGALTIAFGNSSRPFPASGPLVLGAEDPNFTACFVDELRFSNVARWTSSFIPPINAYSFDGTLGQENPNFSTFSPSLVLREIMLDY